MTRFNNDHIDQLIADFLCGEIDAAGYVELEQWIGDDMANRDYFMRMREIWRASRADSTAPLGGFDEAAAYEVFRSRCCAKMSATGRKPRWIRTVLGYAAALAVGIGCTTMIYRSQDIDTNTDSYAEFVAPKGSQSRVNMPDGSYVMLNGGSTFRYPTSYGADTRTVKLRGEGYFSVAHDSATPFLVDIDGATVRVYGTTFTISSYPDDSIATVSLISGHLGMTASDDTVERHIVSGQTLRLDRASGLISKIEYQSEHADWTRGVLSYERMPLSELSRSLERSYGTTIVIADSSLESMKVSGKFFRDTQSLDDILESLAATGRLHFERTANGITIYPN